MSDKPAKPADAAAPEAPPKSKKMLFIIIGAVVFSLAAGGGAAWFFTKGSNAEHKAAEAPPPKDPVFMPLDAFTVNLADGESVMQVAITLQIPDVAQDAALKLQMPRVRSRLLLLLSSQLPENLGSAEGKQKLAHEIKAEINKPFHEKGKPQQVEDVLFTSLIIQ